MGWLKSSEQAQSRELGNIRFHIDSDYHQRLEDAEERLQQTGETETLLEADKETLEVELPPGCGALSDCALRVYLNPVDERGRFHLVGHSVADGSLIYTNSVMIDQLG
jgi:hypothetical protein